MAEETLGSRIKDLVEITSILYQVADHNAAGEMVLDVFSEVFHIEECGLVTAEGCDDEFILRYAGGRLAGLKNTLRFKSSDPINGQAIQISGPVSIQGPFDTLVIGNSQYPLGFTAQACFLFPILFREELTGFILFFNTGQVEIDSDLYELVNVFIRQIGPVISPVETGHSHGNRFDNIISKIIKDRMHEAQLLLSPISFAILRLNLETGPENNIYLEDALKTIQSNFTRNLQGSGDMIWLSVDTIFVVFAEADLLKAENTCSKLSSEMEQFNSVNDLGYRFRLRYVCLGYPESGKNSWEIINNLWLKLFFELKAV